MLKDPIIDRMEYLQRELNRQKATIKAEKYTLNEVVDCLNNAMQFLDGLSKYIKAEGKNVKLTFEAKHLGQVESPLEAAVDS